MDGAWEIDETDEDDDDGIWTDGPITSEEDEDKTEVKEVREMIAKNEARNERFRKLAGF